MSTAAGTAGPISDARHSGASSTPAGAGVPLDVFKNFNAVSASPAIAGD